MTLPSTCIPDLIKRVRALTLRLLPVEVAPEAIDDPTSRVITPQVIDAYIEASGDFVNAVSHRDCMHETDTDARSVAPICSPKGAERVHVGCPYESSRLWRECRKRYVCYPSLAICCLKVHYYVATACEVLARRVVHQAPSDKTVLMLSTRFRFKEVDEGVSEKASALELAIDSHWYAHASRPPTQDLHTCA